jgi:hypothetical protein
MYPGNSTRTPRFSLRSSHDRRLKLGVSHREAPSAWSAPSKDRDAPAGRAKDGGKGGKRR